MEDKQLKHKHTFYVPDALKKAQDVLNKEEPEQSEVDAAYKNLKDAIDGLEKVNNTDHTYYNNTNKYDSHKLPQF